MVAIGAALVALALFALGRQNPAPPASPQVAATSAASPSAAPTPTGAPTSTSTSTSTPTSTPTPSPPPLAAPSATSSLAHLALLADPATRVSIDGIARGSCPLRDLTLDPGTHEVRFTFQPTGESSGERVALRAGERITIRADFSSATPTIRVQR